MPLVTTAFLAACKGCTYDAANKCLVTSPASGGANSWAAVLNDQWFLQRGVPGLEFADAGTAALLVDPTAVPTSGDGFKTGVGAGVQEYSLIIDPASNGPKAVEVG